MLSSVGFERPWQARLAVLASVEPDERRLAGLVNGTLWVLGGLTVAALMVLPGVPRTHPLWFCRSPRRHLRSGPA